MTKFLAALAAFAFLFSSHIANAEGVAGSTVGGAFSLVDGDGNQVTEKSWPGKYKLVFFGFTSCPEICPVTMDAMVEALEKLGPAAEKIQALFITTDPARDTPAVVKDYASKFGKSIIGLTGTEEQLKDAETKYKVYAAKRSTEDGKNYTIDHSGFVYLMSPDDKMVAIMKGSDGSDTIAAKIKPLL
ncbi:MAG TPA: SCO family protein [Patescibacteria group bacterium]|nr:SCO family protein [Patescibacteria group bacterium]